MNTGELLTKGTVWAAMAGYALGAGLYAWSCRRDRWDAIARLAWTLGCAALFLHMVCAFQFYHNWSHTAAYQDTARQTAEMFGFAWGGGLYINYAVLVGWILDVLWWWRGLDLYRRRPRYLVIGWNGFLLFIFFNATVVFAAGFIRCIGLCLCLGLCFLWWRVR